MRKAVTAHVYNYDYFLRVFDINNQLLTRHLPSATLSQVHWLTNKTFPVSKGLGCLYNKHIDKWWLEDKEFLFSGSSYISLFC